MLRTGTGCTLRWEGLRRMARARKGRGAKARRDSRQGGEAAEDKPEEQDRAPLEQVDLLDEIEAVSEAEPDVPEPAEVEPTTEDSEVGAPSAGELDESLAEVGRLEQDGAHELALERLLALQANHPENVAVVARIGSLFGLLGRFGEAEATLEQAHRMSPDDVDIRARIGIVDFKRGLYDQAEAALRWVCDQQEDHGPAYLYRGEALNRLGRTEEALVALERAMELTPDNPKVFHTLGMIYDKRSEPEMAARMYQKARELGCR